MALLQQYARCIVASSLVEGDLPGSLSARMQSTTSRGKWCVMAHPMCVASILESGGPKGSRGHGHEFTTLGDYTCEESELSPFFYATRARVCLPEQRYDDELFHNWPMCQFVFRGAETVYGATRHKEKSHGEDYQWIDREDNDVMWYELQVRIGVTMPEGGHKCNEYAISPERD